MDTLKLLGSLAGIVVVLAMWGWQGIVVGFLLVTLLAGYDAPHSGGRRPRLGRMMRGKYW